MAQKRAKLLEAHGDSREDAYYWLRDDEREDADVIAHLKAGGVHAGAPCGGAGDAHAPLVSRGLPCSNVHEMSLPFAPAPSPLPQAEAEYCKAVLADTEELQEQLYKASPGRKRGCLAFSVG